jgi:predicted nucleic acid-binding protein
VAASVLTCDTSVVVAGLNAWHPQHALARPRLRAVSWLPAHVLAESISVLSRLPHGRAVPMSDAIRLVRSIAEGRARQLPAERYLVTFTAVGSAGLGGGAVYDALVGATAREHNAVLLTLDRKAQRTYTAVGTSFELIT